MSLEEKLQAFFDRIDLRLQSVEQKLDNRLCDVEKRCDKLEVTSKKQTAVQKKVSSDVTKLKVTVSVLEQQRIERNVIIKGIPECDNESTEDLVDTLFSHLDPDFESQFLLNARRIGTKKNNQHRLILAELLNCNRKTILMKGIAAKDINCSLFKKNNGTTWGSADEKIFVSDHLTSYMANVFFRARQLKKNKKIKYAWTKLGMVFVKKDENSRAYNINSVEQLSAFERKLETEVDDDDEADQMDMESDFETSSKASTDSKRQRSPGRIAGRRSPSKRLKQQK